MTPVYHSSSLWQRRNQKMKDSKYIDINNGRTLRPYQSADLNRIERALATTKRVIYRLPTGGGKTIIFAELARRMSAIGKRTLIFTHRRALVSQTVSKLAAAGVNCGVIASGSLARLDESVQVASIQSYARRQGKFTAAQRAFSLVVIDEAHHSSSAIFAKVLEGIDARLLGVTATPMRLDGAPLAPLYKTLINGAGERELIEAGWLADYDLYLPPNMHHSLWRITRRQTEIMEAEATQQVNIAKRCGDAIALYRRHLAGKRAIAFCYSVSDAKANAAAFRSAGITAEAICGNDSDRKIAATIRNYAAGRINVLATCDLISEGFDVPLTAGVLLMRQTMSESLYRQQIGRALRPKAEGGRAIIIDMVGNTLIHGLPDDNKPWHLEGRFVGIRKTTRKRNISEFDKPAVNSYTGKNNSAFLLVDRNVACITAFPFFTGDLRQDFDQCFPAGIPTRKETEWTHVVKQKAMNERDLKFIPGDVEGYEKGWIRCLLADKERYRIGVLNCLDNYY